MCICKRAPSFLFSNITDSSVRPIFWPWLLSAAQNRCGDLLVTELALCTVHCARPEISGCARAEHQPPGPLKQRQQATAYLERIHMKLPTSNCLQSTFQYVNFVNDLMRTPLIQRRQSNPPPPRIFFKKVYSPVIPVSDLNARVLLLSTTVYCSGFWPLIFLWDKD